MKHLFNLFRVLGFESRNHPGTLDHGKFWSTVLLVFTMGFLSAHPWAFSIGVLIVMFSASFGRAMFGRFLESKVVQTRENVKLDVAKTASAVITRTWPPRDTQNGFEPWSGPSGESW